MDELEKNIVLIYYVLIVVKVFIKLLRAKNWNEFFRFFVVFEYILIFNILFLREFKHLEVWMISLKMSEVKQTGYCCLPNLHNSIHLSTSIQSWLDFILTTYKNHAV